MSSARHHRIGTACGAHPRPRSRAGLAAVGSQAFPAQAATLETLLLPAEAGQPTRFERLRRGPTRHSAPALLDALERLEEIRTLGVGTLDLSGIPPSRLKVLSAFAMTAKAQTLRRMRPDRRAATLLALVQTLESTAHAPRTMRPWTSSICSCVISSPEASMSASKPGCGPCETSMRQQSPGGVAL